MPGVATWFERFIDADRVLVILANRDYRDVRAYLGYWNGMEAIARDKEPEPIVSIEDIALKSVDKSKTAMKSNSCSIPSGKTSSAGRAGCSS